MAEKSNQPQQNNNNKTVDLIKSSTAMEASSIEENESISEIKKLSLIRDAFKRKTETIIDDGVKNMQDEKELKLQKAKKLRDLADTTRSMLSQLHNQRTKYHNNIGELVKLCNSFDKTNENSKNENLSTTADSIERQLNELKKL